ncbi:formate dehydrogenase subunit delta [Kushneria marisflavi]|uniref:Formate dehydrogenase n=1 Tax=Kushneria marisflavi TaxID=157779 RepID=A0A240UR76_9GAMM|nr:formate dehydrogenase subunit delta [Kushneria marisflavi]ART63542.1 formate dehydrogenase [Kushneria marisflavi]RKD75829.1 formate dehydrogenase subunit delta [Kushneria marisflavi]
MNDPVVPLIRMVNQISLNNRHHASDEAAAEQIAGHLKKFWARDMKRQIIKYAETDGSELDPLSKLAVARLKTMSVVVRDWEETSDAG